MGNRHGKSESQLKSRCGLKKGNTEKDISQQSTLTDSKMLNFSKSPEYLLGKITDETEKYLYTFKWENYGQEVYVSGTFCDWNDNIPLHKNKNGVWEITLNLPLTTIQYKYFVDGIWLYSDKEKICTDGRGNINNIIDLKALADSIKYTDEICSNFSLRTNPCPISLRIEKVKNIYNRQSKYYVSSYSGTKCCRLPISSCSHLLMCKKGNKNVISMTSSMRIREKVICVTYYKPKY